MVNRGTLGENFISEHKYSNDVKFSQNNKIKLVHTDQIIN